MAKERSFGEALLHGDTTRLRHDADWAGLFVHTSSAGIAEACFVRNTRHRKRIPGTVVSMIKGVVRLRYELTHPSVTFGVLESEIHDQPWAIPACEIRYKGDLQIFMLRSDRHNSLHDWWSFMS